MEWLGGPIKAIPFPGQPQACCSLGTMSLEEESQESPQGTEMLQSGWKEHRTGVEKPGSSPELCQFTSHEPGHRQISYCRL